MSSKRLSPRCRMILPGWRSLWGSHPPYLDSSCTSAQSIQEACRHPPQCDQGAQRLPIQHLYLFPSQTRFQKLETVLDSPTLAIQREIAGGALRISDGPIGKPQPGIEIGAHDVDFDQPHLTGHQVAATLTSDVRRVGHAHGTGSYLHFDRLLASFGYQRRLHPYQFPQLSPILLQVALLPLSVPILKADQPLQMLDPTHQVLVRFPNRAPHRHIIKATIEQPGDGLVVFE